MRDTSLIKGDFSSKPEIITIDEKPDFPDFEYDLMDEKDYKKYMKDLERTIRSTFEYRNMVSFLRDNMDMDQCAFYENVNNRETFRIQIHLHHHPFTLYDICYIVLQKRLKYGESIEIEDVAYEVLSIHYNCLVGLIPLSETVHELVHNKYLFVPLNKVYGNWMKFRELYYQFIDEDMQKVIDENIERTRSYIMTEDEKMILNTKYIYVDTSDLYTIPEDKEVIKEMKDVVKDINNGVDKIKEKKRPKLKYNYKSNNSIF